MRKIAWLSLLALVGVVHADDKKGTVVELEGMKSKAPSAWVSEEPSNKFRYMQFRLPKAEGDKNDAEIVIYKGLGGSTKENFDRWRSDFIPPKGKQIDDVAKENKVKVGRIEADMLQVEGTYKFRERPRDPSSKEVLKPNYKFIGVIVDGKNDVYHIRFTGPAKTVDKYQKGFMDWLKAFE